VPKNATHPDLDRRPWSRPGVYRVPSIRMGRPDLPNIEQEQEGIGRLISSLPDKLGWWPGQGNVYETANEVRLLLQPRITSVTLGRGDLFAEDYLWGPGPAALRCARLCLPHPTEEAWEVVSDRTLLLAGEVARTRLLRSILRSAARAIQEEVGRRALVAPELMDGGGGF
jgi:hypothetical protein